MGDQPEIPICEVCGFDLWLPVATLSVSTVGLYDDGLFPGRCIVMLDEHYAHLDELPAELAAAFTADQQAVGRAMRSVLGCERVNYAVLGNTLPHVHAHLVPRYAGDPVATRTPWEHPAYKGRGKLDPAERDRIISELGAALGHG
jgi:diadenosine tetraphosphate (Ap4A) HIT family hydrolase